MKHVVVLLKFGCCLVVVLLLFGCCLCVFSFGDPFDPLSQWRPWRNVRHLVLYVTVTASRAHEQTPECFKRTIITVVVTMGVRRLFSKGGQEHTFCLKSTKKQTIFLKRVQKHTIFGRPWPARGGKRPPLPPPPCGRPWLSLLRWRW
jgi:hypothetical protein